MTEMDLKLIKMDTKQYYKKLNTLGNKITYNGKTMYDKFELIHEPITQKIVNEHLERKIIIAHSLILKNSIVENIVFDYNGRNPERFYQKAQLLFRNEGYINFTAYNSKTRGHLHVYIHKGHTTLNEGKRLARMLSLKLSAKMPIEWRVFPTDTLPPQYNILALPYEVYQKERGSWAKYM